MRVEIRKLQRRLNTTSIYVYDQLEAMTLADILVVMNGSQVEQIGNPLRYLPEAGNDVRGLLHRRAADEPDCRCAIPDNGLPDANADGILRIRPEDFHMAERIGARQAASRWVLTVEAIK